MHIVNTDHIVASHPDHHRSKIFSTVALLLLALLTGCRPTTTPTVTPSSAWLPVPATWPTLLPAPTPTVKEIFPRIGKTLQALSPRVHLVAFQRLKLGDNGVEELLLLYQDGQYSGAPGRGLIVSVDESTPAVFLGGVGAMMLFNDSWSGYRVADLAGTGRPLLLLFGKMEDGSTLLNAFGTQKPYRFRFQIRADAAVRWNGKTPATLAGQWRVSPNLHQETRVQWDGTRWRTTQHIRLRQSANTDAPDVVVWRFWQAVEHQEGTQLRAYATQNSLGQIQPYLERKDLQLWRLLPRLKDGTTAVYWADLRWHSDQATCWEQSATITLKRNAHQWAVTDLEGGSQSCSPQPPPPLDQ